MKAARCILKVIALGMLVGAAVCAVIAYWDKIVDAFYVLVDKVEELREKCGCCCHSESECEDYADYEEWENV